ncbi:MAG: M1 family metallopeptidase, partial [Flavobacteriaceae bacterium]
SEFALEFGDYQVNITTPADHVLGATGVLTNPKDVMSKTQIKRFEKAEKSFTDPVMIVTQEEAEKAEKGFSTKTKTWSFDAKQVRDFAFASSRKYIWDAMAVDINGKTVMAHSLYPKEGNPLWEEHSTRAVAQTLETYSNYTFDYPYHKAISVHAKRQGMEYPQICFNFGRPNPDGTYSDRTKYRMLGVIIHEVGHNFFPMIVNSDERQWTWMDEGLNSFVQILAMQDYDKDFPISRGLPKSMVRYMGGDQSRISPIMSNGDNVYQFGSNAYAKPAAGLYMLRNTIMGEELFDYAFKTYAQRWKFKHPTPADFFRTMEDASAMELSWFFRGWFYTTDVSDIGIQEVKKFYATTTPTEKGTEMASKRGMTGELVYFEEDTSEGAPMSAEALEATKDRKGDKFFYQVTYNKPGGLVMPILVDITYEDGTKERKVYPAQIWRYNDEQVTKVIPTSKPIKSIVVDTENETADVNMQNNDWGLDTKSKFEQVKNKVKN